MTTRRPRPSHRARPRWRAALEGILIATAGGLILALGRDAVAACIERGAYAVLPVALVLGLALADLASGALHWFCDRFFHARTPIVGATLIAPFREHHDDPQGIVLHGLLELHGNSCIPVIAVLLLARAVPLPLVAETTLLFFVTAALATNQFHRWAHDTNTARAVRWLQSHGVILSPQVHARHHSAAFDQSYCMTTGWLNPLLDRLDFFPRLERGIRALGAFGTRMAGR